MVPQREISSIYPKPKKAKARNTREGKRVENRPGGRSTEGGLMTKNLISH